MTYVNQHIANAEVAIIEFKYQRALNEFRKAEKLHPDERSKNGIREAERLLKEKNQRKMEAEIQKKRADEKYLNMTADNRELGTGLYHI